MVGAVVRDLRHGNVIVSSGEGAVVGIHIADKLGIIRIPPEFRGVPPRHIALDLHAVQKLIEHQRFQKRVVHEDYGEVLQRVFYLAGLVQLQGFLPVLVGELLVCLGSALLGKDRFDFLVLEGKIRHCLEGRQLAGGGIRGALIVQVTETVQAHQVKSVQQPTADRVGGMVAVCELAIVDDDTGRRIGGDIVVTAVHRRRRIHFREKGIDGFLHGIGSAESTHHTRLCQRVGLLGDTVLHHLGLAAGNRPGGGVVPIIVTRKVLIRVKLCAVLHLVEKLAVRGGGRPIHEPGCLVGGIVKEVNADLLCHHAGDCRIFLLADLPFQRNEQTKAGMLRRVFMGGIDAALEIVEQRNFIPDIRGAVVHIQGKQRAAQHHAVFAATFPEMPSDEAAHILDAVLLTLFQLAVFFDRFRGADGAAAAGAEIRPGDVLVLPLFIHAAIADCDLHLCTSSQFSVK